MTVLVFTKFFIFFLAKTRELEVVWNQKRSLTLTFIASCSLNLGREPSVQFYSWQPKTGVTGNGVQDLKKWGLRAYELELKFHPFSFRQVTRGNIAFKDLFATFRGKQTSDRLDAVLREHVLLSGLRTKPGRHSHPREEPWSTQRCWQLCPSAQASRPGKDTSNSWLA